MPRVVIGIPLYENVDDLPEALESLLGQTFRDVAFVACDDSASAIAEAIIRRYAERDARLSYERNPRRLGMTANWRRVFERGRSMYPDAEYFAWGSDHDAWHPRWLESLVALLDAHPEAVLAYPQNIRISGAGEPLITPWRFDTAGVHEADKRLSIAAREMFAGDMVYGLFRAQAQERAGIFRSVLLPDRLLLSELAVYGEFVQVPEILWYRRFMGIASLQRQRAAFYPDGAPWHSYVPWWLTHPAVLAYNLAVLGRGEPEIGRTRGLALAASFVRVDVRFELLRKVQRAHARLRKRMNGPRRFAGRVVTVGAQRGWRWAVIVQRAHAGAAQTRRRFSRASAVPGEKPPAVQVEVAPAPEAVGSASR